MKVITLHHATDGSSKTVSTDDIKDVQDQPRGQCWVTFRDGTFMQPQESVEEVTRIWKESNEQ
jgi:hypothetical protein